MYSEIKYFIIDVDGTMTDGSVYYDNNGNEWKKFNTKDGLGLLAIKQVGMKAIILTGRNSQATARRMEELSIQYVFQNVKNKRKFLNDFMKEHHIKKEQVAYIGDDLNDYEAMKLAGFRACPSDACEEVKNFSIYISSQKGGDGAVRDVIGHVLKIMGKWDEWIKDIQGTGI